MFGVAAGEEGGLRRGAAELSRRGKGQAEAARDQDDAAVDPESLLGFLPYVAFERFARDLRVERMRFDRYCDMPCPNVRRIT